jgi:DNA-binding CsgD family transcriptional regulator
MSDTQATSAVCSLFARTINPVEEPGILLLSASLELIGTNAKASSILHRLHPTENARNISCPLPFILRSLCQALLHLLPVEPCPADWHRLHLIQIIEDACYSFLFRGVGIPDMFGRNEGRLLIILVPLVTQHAAAQYKSIDRITLTPRESHVAQHLADGLTNKEIANKLGLSEYTVKDHVKRLMRKTHTTTRTGVVRQLLALHNFDGELGRRRLFRSDDEKLKNIA